jgi:hypothetical protein
MSFVDILIGCICGNSAYENSTLGGFLLSNTFISQPIRIKTITKVHCQNFIASANINSMFFPF